MLTEIVGFTRFYDREHPPQKGRVFTATNNTHCQESRPIDPIQGTNRCDVLVTRIIEPRRLVIEPLLRQRENFKFPRQLLVILG